jgi:hypothetical protein
MTPIWMAAFPRDARQMSESEADMIPLSIGIAIEMVICCPRRCASEAVYREAMLEIERR